MIIRALRLIVVILLVFGVRGVAWDFHSRVEGQGNVFRHRNDFDIHVLVFHADLLCNRFFTLGLFLTQLLFSIFKIG